MSCWSGPRGGRRWRSPAGSGRPSTPHSQASRRRCPPDRSRARRMCAAPRRDPGSSAGSRTRRTVRCPACTRSSTLPRPRRRSLRRSSSCCPGARRRSTSRVPSGRSSSGERPVPGRRFRPDPPRAPPRCGNPRQAPRSAPGSNRTRRDHRRAQQAKALSSSAEKTNSAVELFDGSAGPESIVVSGGVRSTVHSTRAATGSRFPAVSVARTSKLCRSFRQPLVACRGRARGEHSAVESALEARRFVRREDEARRGTRASGRRAARRSSSPAPSDRPSRPHGPASRRRFQPGRSPVRRTYADASRQRLVALRAGAGGERCRRPTGTRSGPLLRPRTRRSRTSRSWDRRGGRRSTCRGRSDRSSSRTPPAARWRSRPGRSPAPRPRGHPPQDSRRSAPPSRGRMARLQASTRTSPPRPPRRRTPRMSCSTGPPEPSRSRSRVESRRSSKARAPGSSPRSQPSRSRAPRSYAAPRRVRS